MDKIAFLRSSGEISFEAVSVSFVKYFLKSGNVVAIMVKAKRYVAIESRNQRF
jgi:hypothetical protein